MELTPTNNDQPVMRSRSMISQQITIEIFNDPPPDFVQVDLKLGLFCVCLTFVVEGETTAKIALI